MITTKLNELIAKRGTTLYKLSKATGIPYVSLWALSQKEINNEVPESIHLSVLGRLCTVLNCKPNDLLHHTIDAEDEAMLALIKAREQLKTDKKTGAKNSKKGAAKK